MTTSRRLDAHLPRKIPVGRGAAAYDVLVGRNLTLNLPGMLGDDVTRVLLVYSEALARLAEPVRARLVMMGTQVTEGIIPDAEEAKTVEIAAQLWGVLGRAGFTRTDAVVTVGGGATTDLGGFVAATWLRGIRVVHVPTTLLGMVDAAVGGKTGINTSEGKNLVGAFHPPAGVLCDLGTLVSLPAEDFTAGMAEVVKAGFIADRSILDAVEADPHGIRRPDSPALQQVVRASIQVKADVVTADLKESFQREILNYGHTFGHAIEHVEDYTWRHGDAVAVGMVYAAELGHRSGHLGADDLQRHRRVLTRLGLPTTYRPDRWDELLTAMRRDKKTRGDTLRFVVLDGIGHPTRLTAPSESLLREAYDAVSG